MKIRQKTYCKLNIKHNGALTAVPGKMNQMNVRVAAAKNVELHFVYIPVGSPFSSAQVEDLEGGQVKKIEKIKSGESWWVMYEPLKLKSGYVKVESWVTLEDIPLTKAEKLAKEAAAKQALIDAKKAEEERQAAIKKAQ